MRRPIEWYNAHIRYSTDMTVKIIPITPPPPIETKHTEGKEHQRGTHCHQVFGLIIYDTKTAQPAASLKAVYCFILLSQKEVTAYLKIKLLLLYGWIMRWLHFHFQLNHTNSLWSDVDENDCAVYTYSLLINMVLFQINVEQICYTWIIKLWSSNKRSLNWILAVIFNE